MRHTAAVTRLQHARSVVAFGGGTGLGRLMSALSFLGDRLVGVVTTTDDGGSTGRLRSAAGCIAWGDLRHCFNQICTESTLSRLLFEYRFVDSGELSGHNLGNLMLLALDQLTARPLDAVNLVREFLGVAPRELHHQRAALVAGAGDPPGRGPRRLSPGAGGEPRAGARSGGAPPAEGAREVDGSGDGQADGGRRVVATRSADGSGSGPARAGLGRGGGGWSTRPVEVGGGSQ